MTLVQKFTEKYGINPIKLVEDANLKFFGEAKSMGLEKLLSEYVDTEGIILVNNDFIKELVECFAEEKKKFPENVKATVDTGTKFEIPNQMSSIPKSKGTLENFKDIVGTDGLRPIMMGVYVSEDGFIVGTDAHKLVKQKNNGLLSQTDYAGKIIDLTKYLKSNGKLIDFVDGVFPKYDAVIPRESPYEDRQLSTYAFYNYAKSSLEVKRLLNSDVFNVNFNLMTDTSGGTKRFSFGYHVLLDALNFAMLNNWDFFTLRYSEPNRAVLFDFGGDNVILVMPMIDRYDSSAEGGSTGTIPLTTEEVEEKYRLGLKQQKSSKPAKAPKKATVSAPVNSEPFKKFEGNLSDTTYIPRREIASITLRNGDVLSGNDVIDGFYRVNKKMAHGGSMFADGGSIEGLKVGSKVGFLRPRIGRYEWAEVLSIDGDNVNLVVRHPKRKQWDNYFTETKQRIEKYINTVDENWHDGRGRTTMKIKYEHGGSMYADGGNTGRVKVGVFSEADLRSGADKKAIEKAQKQTGLTYIDNKVIKKGGKMFMEVYLVPTEEYLNSDKFEHGGSMYADGGNTGRVKVGVFSEADLRSGADKKAIEKAQKQTGLTYIDNKVIKKGGKMFMEVYLVPTEEYLNSDKFEHGGSMYADGGNMFETPIAKYKEVSGKVVGSVPVSEEVYSSQVKDFVEYVYEVYEDYGFTKKQVKEAVDKYIKELGYQFTWGGGDSLDRERVYEYLRNPNLQGIKNPSFANGGSMSKSYEIGDIISFNSVMGGTKTGAIVSKLGEDGFRIKTEDGFATVKKSAIV